MAFLALPRHAGTCLGRVFPLEHVVSSAGCSPNPPKNTCEPSIQRILSHLGVCQRQCMDMVINIPHERRATSVWCLILSYKHVDLPLTEKLDYFSAALAIFYALYHTVIRLANFYSPPSKLDGTNNERSFLRVGWAVLCITVYLSHVTYLTILPRFDYTYNMAFNLVLGVSHNILWLLYSLPAPFFRRFPYASKTYYPRHIYKAGIFVLLTTATTAFEVFDFPPLGRVLDAHALWHLSTAPITKFWYDFLVEDSQNECWWRSQK